MNMAWRSLLAPRSVPLLPCFASPAARRHGRGGGGVYQIMEHTSRGYWTHDHSWSDYDYAEYGCPAGVVKAEDGAGGGSPATSPNCGSCERPARRPRRRHLYVVLDDWRKGFSVHKLDLSGAAGPASPSSQAAAEPGIAGERLPPPAVRMEFSNVSAGARFAALGSRIVACTQGPDGATVVYDTGAASQAIVPRSPEVLRDAWQAAVAAGDDRLYAFASNSKARPPPVDTAAADAPSRQSLGTDGDDDDNDDSGDDGHQRQVSTGEMYHLEEVIERHPGEIDCYDQGSKRWSWSPEPSPLPFNLDRNGTVTSYAVHPDGNTIFVSVTPATPEEGGGYHCHGGYHGYSGGCGFGYHGGNDEFERQWRRQVEERDNALAKTGTYSYHVKSRTWKHLGTWMLPFAGHAHYDGELDAWVGHGPSGSYGPGDKIGCCDVIGSPPSPEPPSWKPCEEMSLSSLTRWKWLTETALVAMGGGRFCLVECAPRKEMDDLGDPWGDGDKFELLVTAFRLKYDKNGAIQVTDRRVVRSHVLSRYSCPDEEMFSMQAFWM
ncbi:hypothetical protein ACP4OV_027916 [Aristida adscensionis]